ncbi:hypothetical protein [Pinibacter soli]|uniref:MFS transporter n=1 Tax=Pinibacter soli TaxID=3044211 RepID=A0ABT6R9X6_9BACT|nr:hypothetical protein [Pinibacter soli]MDI3318704.1 hypothetical protein [Pinibacter soli]
MKDLNTIHSEAFPGWKRKTIVEISPIQKKTIKMSFAMWLLGVWLFEASGFG